jgi:hypothetical protein
MKNWKTSLVGCIIAVCVAVQPLLGVTGKLDWKSIALAAVIALFGFISKDFDKTGL